MQALRKYTDAAGGLLPLSDQKEIQQLAYRLAAEEQNLQEVYRVYVEQVEYEYKHWCAVVDAATDWNATSEERMNSSVKMADEFGVQEDKILRSEDDLRRLFEE
jgi:hypothetical protein